MFEVPLLFLRQVETIALPGVRKQLRSGGFQGDGKMKRSVVVACVCLALGLVPSLISAQDSPVIARHGALALYAPIFYGGFSGKHKGLVIDALDVPDTGAEATVERLWEGDLGGAWFSLMGALAINDKSGIRGSGAILLPHTTTGRQNTEFGIVYPSVQAKSYYWDVAAYWQLGEICRALGGFRWDFVEADFYRYQTVTGGFIMRRDGVHRFEVNAYLPYLGVEIAYPSAGGNLTVGALGFPLVLGNFQEGVGDASDLGAALGSLMTGSENTLAFDKGYFVELYCNYSRRFLRDGLLGAFLKWDAIRARTTEITTNINNVGIGLGFAGGRGGPSNPHTYSYGFRKETFTVGASVSFDFQLL